MAQSINQHSGGSRALLETSACGLFFFNKELMHSCPPDGSAERFRGLFTESLPPYAEAKGDPP
jgi:hypothetical protein